MPIREDHPLQGQSPYSASKIGADKMAEACHAAFGLPVVTLRPFNTFGPRQSARAVIPTIISQGLAGGAVHLGNLTPTRDLTFVADTVGAYLQAGAVPGIEGRTVHLGTGREISIGDLAALIGKLLGKDLQVTSDERRLRPGPSEVDRLVSDNTLARELLGWTPALSLEEGLERTIAWMRDHAHHFRPGDYTV